MFTFLTAALWSRCDEPGRKGDMTMEMEQTEKKQKRSYFAATLLVIITLMMVVIVILLSRYLVQQQQDWLEDGMRLAEKYEESSSFVQKLHDGADLLLGSGGQQTEGKLLLAQAVAHSRHFVDLMAEAESREKGIRLKEARDHYAAEMEQFLEKLGAAGDPGQWFSGPDSAVLEAVRDEASQMSEALKKFRLPTVDAGFRMMAAGEGWLEPALAAAGSWANLMNQLQQSRNG
jgi:hypothetical protein